MRIHVSIMGHGREYIIGNISEEIWDYIQNNFDGSFQDYMMALDDDEVPDEFKIAECESDIYECGDVYYEENAILRACQIDFSDDAGNVLYSIKGDDIYDNDGDDSSIPPYEDSTISLTENLSKYFFVTSEDMKGTFFTGTLEIDGEFDQRKLKIYTRTLDYNADDDGPFVYSIYYDGKEFEDDGMGSNTWGKGRFHDVYELDD